MKVVVHYAEIGLKGKNRYFFENKLVENIKRSAKEQNISITRVQKQHKRLICHFDATLEEIEHVLKPVFGIKYYAPIVETTKTLTAIKKAARNILEQLKEAGHEKIAFKTKRGDKMVPYTSPEVNKELGAIASELGMKVDYKGAAITLYTEVSQKQTHLYTERIPCLGGLPVSTAGSVLLFLSGGIDSPVAAWNMMRRGCTVDFLHVHTYRTNKEAYKSKIGALVKILNKHQFQARLHVVPYEVYEFAIMGKLPSGAELVFFKNYLFKLGERLAKEYGYQGIVTGDNLAQVASQTLQNMKMSGEGVELPIFRPLLTYEKEEIVALAEKIGTYESSIQVYKDCCSILARNPNTNVKSFGKAHEEIDMSGLVEESIKRMETYTIPEKLKK